MRRGIVIKKIKKLVGILSVILMLCLQVVLLSAAPTDTQENIISVEREYLENGDYIETVLAESPIALYGSGTKSGSKTSTYYSNGTALWYVKVTGSFAYTGNSVRCTSAYVDADSYTSFWKITDRSSSRSGNIATARATGTHFYGNTILETIDKSVSLSCSVDGSLY